VQEEFYGIFSGIYHNNLQVKKKIEDNNSENFNEAIEICFDQKNGYLSFKSPKYEFFTDKLKPDEDYKLLI